MKIELTNDEALVLFDFLDKNHEKIDNCNDAIKYVSWCITNQLESVLIEPHYDNYNELVEKAKENITIEYEGLE